jgi:hypothetical protein
MKKQILIPSLLLLVIQLGAQTNPAVTSWLINTTGLKGRHYVQGNPTPIQDNTPANVQSVQYSDNWVYVKSAGIPSYITGPFLDGNPSIAQAQSGYFKLPLNPVLNTGTQTPTTGGNIGIFINGVALFDYRDGDLDVISSVCDLYLADGLYAIDSTVHSPLIGYAYDGFPIYGAYGYKNTDGTGGLARIKSGYQLRNITARTHHANGTDVPDGPLVSTAFPPGYFREDYEFVTHPEPDYLDEHNGRFCVTPEYPQGIYAYFATVDAAWNSAYPYVVGPTFYGVRTATKVQTITEQVTTYNPSTGTNTVEQVSMEVGVFPNPSGEFFAVQVQGLLENEARVQLFSENGSLMQETAIQPGSTICYLDARTLYAGVYMVKVSVGGDVVAVRKVVVE